MNNEMYFKDSRPSTVYFAKCTSCTWESGNFLEAVDTPCMCVECGCDTTSEEDVAE